MKKRRLSTSQIVVSKLTSLTVSIFDIAMAYLVIDLIAHYTLTWPVLLLAVWVTDTAVTQMVRKDLYGI